MVLQPLKESNPNAYNFVVSPRVLNYLFLQLIFSSPSFWIFKIKYILEWRQIRLDNNAVQSFITRVDE